MKLPFCLLITLFSSPALPAFCSDLQGVAFAGVPYSLGSTANYDLIFKSVSNADGKFFYPTFEYEEAPEVKTLGLEKDFYLPCKEGNTAIEAMRKHHVKLLLPVHFLYPNSAPLPPKDEDPLRNFISCYGRRTLFAVVTYDEPIHTKIPIEKVAAVYKRIKEVDASLPVLMIHAPVTHDRQNERSVREAYTSEVKLFSRYSDLVGFDIYPIPWMAAKILDPETGLPTKNADEVVTVYARWLQKHLREKQHTLVLQAFSYKDHYAPQNMPALTPDVFEQIQLPSLTQMQAMTTAARRSGIRFIVWWGQSLRRSDDTLLWNNLKEASHGFTSSLK
jgi:hypothetical protein